MRDSEDTTARNDKLACDGKLVGALSRRNIMRSLVEAIDMLER